MSAAINPAVGSSRQIMYILSYYFWVFAIIYYIQVFSYVLISKYMAYIQSKLDQTYTLGE
jgi:hypothetical protein